MSKHTPGPWKIADGDSLRCSLWGWSIMSSDGYWVAVAHEEEEESDKANARLIAAAPEMLEALKRVEDWMIHNTVPTDRPASIDKAVIDAIAKAETV